MKLKIRANEIIDGEIEFVSLVKRGANRSPFKIIKQDEAQDAPVTFEQALSNIGAQLQRAMTAAENITKRDQTMKQNRPTPTQVRKAAARETRVEELRAKIDSLNVSLHRLWEQPNHPLFRQLDADLSMQIEKAELELGGLTDDSHEMNQRSAFFYRGGTSVRSEADCYDSAFERDHAALRKAEQQISLETQITQTDDDDVAEIDLDAGFKL